MSIVLLEGFDDGLHSSRVSGYQALSSSYGLHGKGVYVGDYSNGQIITPLPGSATSVNTIGFAFNIHSSDGNQRHIAYFYNANRDYIYVRHDYSGQRLHFHILTSATPTIDEYTSNGSIKVGDWHYLEVQLKGGTSSDGAYAWWLDGKLIGSGTGVDYNLNPSEVRIGGTDGNYVRELWIDDLYETNDTGTTNTGNLGPIEVVTLLPDGNGNSSNMVGSDGNSTDNYLLVDNNASVPPSSTEYVGSATEGDLDTYTMGDLSGTPTVKGVIASLYAARTETGPKYMRPIVRTSSSDYTGDSEALAASYSLHEHVWDQNPNTSSDWTYTEVNGMEIGQEVRDS